MRKSMRSILLIAVIICALAFFSGCGIDTSSLGASASSMNEPKETVTEEPVDEAEEEYEDDEMTDEEEQADLEQEEEESNLELTVWLTKTGKCYHIEGCKYLKSKARSLTQKEAIDEGYSACSKCISARWLPKNYTGD